MFKLHIYASILNYIFGTIKFCHQAIFWEYWPIKHYHYHATHTTTILVTPAPLWSPYHHHTHAPATPCPDHHQHHPAPTTILPSNPARPCPDHHPSTTLLRPPPYTHAPATPYPPPSTDILHDPLRARPAQSGTISSYLKPQHESPPYWANAGLCAIVYMFRTQIFAVYSTISLFYIYICLCSLLYRILIYVFVYGFAHSIKYIALHICLSVFIYISMFSYITKTV